MKTDDRLSRLKALLASKLATHTNPIEIGPKDLSWLIEQAGRETCPACGARLEKGGSDV